MPVWFVDLAHNCAPSVATETLAGIVSLESRFEPFNIRINSGPPLKQQPASKAEAIEVAAALVAGHQDIQLGLAGLGLDDLSRLNLTIAEAFDPCLNLKATATLLDSTYRRAIRAGADETEAGKIMLQSFYGGGDITAGSSAEYDNQIQREIERLKSTNATLTVHGHQDGQHAKGSAATSDAIVDVVAKNSGRKATSDATAPSWDVFKSRRQSSVLVFQNQRGGE
ncbi:type IV secretion system protein VirB1 [Ochrobactrum sp. 30A/1000/2015]|uniref:lytic transglycosylase domain-containing protein n=1 Tax=Brucella TaxID=234 RepID=UPI0004685634|nr:MULTISPECIES: lytic transglycosylase domain-containing protein [Brucella/Ochrobactrum group]KAB2670149.1 lytic transglycosylase domain-containing protein [Ochrobactrum sp. LMG 5442]PJT21469.1 type IV secretion system protein VirB1 [Ochrobactrum sp. 30A/1000/2015]PJT39262.1 type IV secretion system protein VirB1 [Ochrobactrum sp. 27A/999/2015]PJT43555.1 type IV secretion system protein VirB1 [Ochrobactrum sp. 23A/997/2015]UXO84790.1 lytic transglycosylase domain-containing protein [Brucella 